MKREEKKRAVEELLKIARVKGRIKNSLEIVKELESLEIKLGQGIARCALGGKSESAAEKKLRMSAAREMVQSESERLDDAMREVLGKIEKIEDTTSKTLLELRYVLGFDWKRIADEMSYSLPHVKGFLHNKALEDFFAFEKS